MALTATIFKASLEIADIDRNYYASHQLTVARHPSETDQRMMVRLLAFALHAGNDLAFTRGLCVDDEPELWQKNLSGEVALWIDIGLPDERRIRKACQRAENVILYLYGGRAAGLWWQRHAEALQRFANLRVFELSEEHTTALAGFVRRGMTLQCTVQDGQVWLSDECHNLAITPVVRKPGRNTAR